MNNQNMLQNNMNMNMMYNNMNNNNNMNMNMIYNNMNNNNMNMNMVNNNNMNLMNNNNMNMNMNMNMMNNLRNMAQNTAQVMQFHGVNFNQNNNFNNNNMNNNQMNNNIEAKKYPHKTGLENLGQTCYMNSSLQCLANIKSFSNILLNLYNQLNPNTQKLTYAYTSLLYQLKNSNEKYKNPSQFKSILGELNPLFEGNHASDAKDLIMFILQRLHLELKLPKQPQYQNPKLDFKQQEQISLDDKLSRAFFINDFMNNQSCVAKIFHGIMRIQLECDGCKKIKYSYQTFNLITFILKKISDEQRKIDQEFYPGINIYNAFENDKKTETLTGENMIYCNTCQASHSGKTQQSIYILPAVLIIVLNRGRDNQDFNEQFDFPEVLDLSTGNYVIENTSYKRFYLCGLITHLGESSSSGHFICYCRNDLNDPFVCYNDTQVSEGIEIDEGMRCNISYKSEEKRTPYILFYHQF